MTPVLGIWQQWLEQYGGFPAFLSAMAVFFGGYVLLVGLLDVPSVGRRRALALFCLALGLLVGLWVGHASFHTVETTLSRLFKP